MMRCQDHHLSTEAAVGKRFLIIRKRAARPVVFVPPTCRGHHVVEFRSEVQLVAKAPR